MALAHQRWYARRAKPAAEFILAALGLLASLPLTVPVALALAVANGGTPFFTQRRPGLHGKHFTIYKFKTMNNRRGPDGSLLPDAVRLTQLGTFVRKTSIDELPQLINVLLGQLSLIGPRPLLIEYLPLYSPEQARRHLVRPGITGWAQVNGRNAISWQQKFAYDVYYVENISPALDLQILLKTVRNVLAAKDISADGQATIEKFTG